MKHALSTLTAAIIASALFGLAGVHPFNPAVLFPNLALFCLSAYIVSVRHTLDQLEGEKRIQLGERLERLVWAWVGACVGWAAIAYCVWWVRG